MDRGAWWDTARGVTKELGTTYLLNNNNILTSSHVFRFSIFFIFHDSVLENFMILRFYPGCPICWQILVIVGEGNGNPLQYSCLENPMEGGAW